MNAFEGQRGTSCASVAFGDSHGMIFGIYLLVLVRFASTFAPRIAERKVSAEAGGRTLPVSSAVPVTSRPYSAMFES